MLDLLSQPRRWCPSLPSGGTPRPLVGTSTTRPFKPQGDDIVDVRYLGISLRFIDVPIQVIRTQLRFTAAIGVLQEKSVLTGDLENPFAVGAVLRLAQPASAWEGGCSSQGSPPSLPAQIQRATARAWSAVLAPSGGSGSSPSGSSPSIASRVNRIGDQRKLFSDPEHQRSAWPHSDTNIGVALDQLLLQRADEAQFSSGADPVLARR